ncbi:hypothetical protein [Heyndrickxia sporothermodurans]|nr:hypothetical protein [Heyndrickxia sporothermodurans]
MIGDVILQYFQTGNASQKPKYDAQTGIYESQIEIYDPQTEKR